MGRKKGSARPGHSVMVRVPAEAYAVLNDYTLRHGLTMNALVNWIVAEAMPVLQAFGAELQTAVYMGFAAAQDKEVTSG